MQRALENSTVQLHCYKGYVHPTTQRDTFRIKCILNSSNEGQWDSVLPDACVIVDCGEPPLGVHAYPPQVRDKCMLL